MACVFPGVLGLCRMSFCGAPFYVTITVASVWASAVAEFWAPLTEEELPWQWFFFVFHCEVHVPEEDVFSYPGVPLDGGELPLRLHEVVPAERVPDVSVAWLRRIRLW